MEIEDQIFSVRQNLDLFQSLAERVLHALHDKRHEAQGICSDRITVERPEKRRHEYLFWFRRERSHFYMTLPESKACFSFAQRISLNEVIFYSRRWRSEFVIQEVFSENFEIVARLEWFVVPEIGAYDHTCIGQTEKILTEHPVHKERICVPADPNVITVIKVIRRGRCSWVFLYHGIFPCRWNELSAVPHTPVHY